MKLLMGPTTIVRLSFENENAIVGFIDLYAISIELLLLIPLTKAFTEYLFSFSGTL